ncbi:MAG: COX aromatic rich motif-containing protein [Verrucomicrobia bacterium]|nr:COX aromatic rich motif-containing protein [Verrucomicrobiota bacterium]MBS0637071.1 COX aromatic rich motif-containing protein [Verrucomicrobiota bacterium]
MKFTKHPLFYFLSFALAIILFVLIMQPLSILHFGEQIVMLFPDGLVALIERNLLFVIQAMMLLVIIPVFVMTFIFSWKYNAKNPKGEYDPDLVDNVALEYIWWGVPIVMVTIISALIWHYTYELDPFKPLDNRKPLKVQVVALQWKWLFIYPEAQVASVNFLQIPKDRPIHFEITADAPMNSFWIPSLGSQIYAMPNMKTQLNLIANSAGDFRGCSANISGVGFSGMYFTTRASSEEEFEKWLKTASQMPSMLNIETYNTLAKPSSYNPVAIYKLQDPNLFDHVLMKFMHPQ